MKRIIIVIALAILMAGISASCKTKYPNKHHQNKDVSFTHTKGFNKIFYARKGGERFHKGKYWRLKAKNPLD